MIIMKMDWILFAAAFAVAVSSGLEAHPEHGYHEQPPWQEATPWPDRLVATLSGDPTSQFSVSWRTDASVGVAIAQIAEAIPEARFDLEARTVRAVTQELVLDHVKGPKGKVLVLENQGLRSVHYHSVDFENLEPDTLYAYRVRGRKGMWSPWRQLRTAPLEAPFQFIFFGDAQTGIRSHVTRTFDMASVVASEARFAIHGGDLVNTAMYDKEWAEWFDALGRSHALIPSIPVAGNHDYINFDKDKDRSGDGKLFATPNKRVTPIWRSQFRLPIEKGLPDGLWETVYDVQYGEDLHIFVLDSSGIAWREQLDWLEAKLKKSDAKWKILTMHHPLFSFIGGNEHPSHKARRIPLLETLKLKQLDLVLTGHRHSYQRGVYGDDVARFSVGEPHAIDTVFLITATSTKRGETKVEGWERYSGEQDGDFKLNRYADNIPLFAVFDLDESVLQYRAFDATGEVYDAFMLRKDEAGRKTIENDDVVMEPVKNYRNTKPYRKWDDLR